MKKIISVIALALLMTGCENAAQPAPQTEATVSVTESETVTETGSETESDDAAETTITTAEATTTEIPFEDTPENAYERLIMSFMQPDGSEIAPDDYAGVYSYFGTLYVAVTTEVPSEYYTELLDDYTCVQYTSVSLSLGELTYICERGAELLEPEFGVEEYYVDIPSNKAAVVIAEGDPKEAQNYLKTIEDPGFELSDLEIIVYEPEE